MYRISRLPKNRMIFEYILLSVIREIFFTTIKNENEVRECFFFALPIIVLAFFFVSLVFFVFNVFMNKVKIK